MRFQEEKMKKTLIALLLVAMMAVSLVACTQSTPAAPAATEPTAEQPAAEAATEAPASEPIPHTEVEIKWPAIIEVNEEVFANENYKIAYANWNDENSISIIVRDSVLDACKYYGVECMVFDNKQDANQAMTNCDASSKGCRQQKRPRLGKLSIVFLHIIRKRCWFRLHQLW